MAELRETHLGVRRPKPGPSVAASFKKAYEAVVNQRMAVRRSRASTAWAVRRLSGS